MSDISKSLDKYCVFGNPIAHSLSPRIHSLFAAQTGEELVYEKQLVGLDEFAQAVTTFFAEGGKGLNITVPFKQEAWALAQKRSERAQLAGAVNTLWLDEDGKLCGDNTDGAGLVNDICVRLAWPAEGKNILMLGAGGAARGVLLPLLQQQPTTLVIANRTLAKAGELRDLFQPYTKAGKADTQIYACAFTELAGQRFDLIVNATSASLSDDLPPLPAAIVHSETRGYDMVYAKQPTSFMRWCSQQGAAAVSDGLGMLVGQAAESFAIWRGKKPDVVPVMKSLSQA